MNLALVTGASRGLGQALCERLLALGWHVAGMARGSMDSLARHAHFHSLPVDLTDSIAAANALTDAIRRHAGVDCAEIWLINNAGTVEPVAPVGRLDAAAVATAIAVNLTSAITLSNAFIAATADLPARRKVLGVSSGAAQTAYAGWGAYCAGKAGLDHFSRCVALEQQGTDNPVAIASIAPGVIDTEMQQVLRDTPPADFPAHQRFVALKDTGGLQTPQAVAAQLIDLMQSPHFGEPVTADLRNLRFDTNR